MTHIWLPSHFLAIKSPLIGYEYAISGETVRANDAISQLQHLATRTYVPAIYMASVYTGLHNLDHALERLDKAHDERCENLVYLPTEPLADPLRGDPRFRKLLQRLRLKTV